MRGREGKRERKNGLKLKEGDQEGDNNENEISNSDSIVQAPCSPLPRLSAASDLLL
ncbi:hypothetical protein SESBI_45657 [Sesbania bispinosa]|nr:hypothetical protein SESBI_45657 [Sesbania bispinosa]